MLLTFNLSISAPDVASLLIMGVSLSISISTGIKALRSNIPSKGEK